MPTFGDVLRVPVYKGLFTEGRYTRLGHESRPPSRWNAWLRGCGHLLCRCTREGSLGLPLVGSTYEAAAEEIEARSAKHLAFQHFEAIDMALDRTARPGQ